MYRLFRPLLMVSVFGSVVSGCGDSKTPTTEPNPWTEVEFYSSPPVVESDVVLQMHLSQVTSFWFKGVSARVEVTNLRDDSILYYVGGCGGGFNPYVHLRDGAGNEYDFQCEPRPLCPIGDGPVEFPPGESRSGGIGLTASFCQGRYRGPLESGHYTLVASFGFLKGTGEPGETLTQTIPFDWDAETLTGSVPD